MQRIPRAGLLLTAALGLFATTTGVASADAPLHTYEVTVTNQTAGEPLSPLLAVTHRPATSLFDAGAPAGPGLVAIAEMGDNGPASVAAQGDRHVADVFAADVPLIPSGAVVDGLSSTITFTIEARPGDRLSLATMLVCTNDGFGALDSVGLPRSGELTLALSAWDAGSEVNSEAAGDLVAPCDGLAENGGVDEGGVVTAHPGIVGGAFLDPVVHGWDAVAEVVIRRT